jgi:hypothetical protein
VTLTEAHPATLQLVEGDAVLADASEGAALQWDTTATDDGLHKVAVRAIDAAGNVADSAEWPLVVANGGQESAVTYSPAAEVVVPQDWRTAETDVRGFVTNPGGVKRIVTWLTWDGSSGLQLAYALGIGTCPDRGIKFVGTESENGEAVLDLKRADVPAAAAAKLPPGDETVFPVNSDPETLGTFFGHIAIENPDTHVGARVPVKIHFLLVR